MSHRKLKSNLTALGVAAAALSVAAGAVAQPPPPPPDYGYGRQAPPPPSNYAPPPSQDGYAPPPPPQGYDPRYDDNAQARAEDQRYAYAAERWATENCVEQRANNTAAGAVIGGIFGALVGSSVAGRHDRGAGAVVGGATGAIAGAAIGSSANASDPNCPPGYVLRSGGRPFYGGPAWGGGVVYMAPAGYNPWAWYGGRWVYRPYPYHRYYYHHYYRR